MHDLTIEETDRMIEKLCEAACSEQELQSLLRKAATWQNRWVSLEQYIVTQLEEVGLSLPKFHTLWIRERFFHEMQKRTGRDYGFCQYHINTYRNRTESLLTENLNLDLDHKCSYQTEDPIMTTCSGTEREKCVFLHPELREKREKEIEGYARHISRSFSAPLN